MSRRARKVWRFDPHSACPAGSLGPLREGGICAPVPHGALLAQPGGCDTAEHARSSDQGGLPGWYLTDREGCETSSCVMIASTPRSRQCFPLAWGNLDTQTLFSVLASLLHSSQFRVNGFFSPHCTGIVFDDVHCHMNSTHMMIQQGQSGGPKSAASQQIDQVRVDRVHNGRSSG